jgi:SAM-dependent methyltransferase
MSKTEDFATNQFNDWNGASGESWVRRQKIQDLVLAPMSASLFAAAKLQPGERVLDIGCGCGDTTLAAARHVDGAGAALGVDISIPMVTRAEARAKAEGLGARFAVADAASYPFQPGGFDVLISRFGVMFFPEPEKAFANLRKALRPGGRLVFVCWQSLRDNEWMILPLRAALKHVPRLPKPDPDEPGPFAFADEGKVRRILEGSGFRDVTMTKQSATLDIAAGQGFETALGGATTIGPASRALRAASESERAAGIEAIRGELMTRLDGVNVRLGAAPWLVEARA